MASPQRPEFQGAFDNEKGLRPGHPPARQRAGFLFAWLIAVLLFAAFLYWIAFGWGGTGGYWWHHQAAPTRANNGRMIKGTGLNALNATTKTAYIDQNFQVKNVPIQKKVNDRIYWIGPSGRAPMLVVVGGNANSTNMAQLAPGDLANVAGTIDKAPPPSQAVSQWPLSSTGLARLEKEGAYVRATQMNWASR